jgi:hypothetical protein
MRRSARAMLGNMNASEAAGSSQLSHARWFPRLCTRLAHERAWPGALSIWLAGTCWAVLCVMLASAGHMPSRTLVPIARAHYYAAQAFFVTPLLLFLWLLCTTVASRAARALGGRGSWTTTANCMGLSLAGPLLLLFLLPDLISYQLLGFSALGLLVRVTGPLSFLGSVVLATLMLRISHGLPSGRAALAATAGVLAQGLVAAILLR